MMPVRLASIGEAKATEVSTKEDIWRNKSTRNGE
jgi:hypothetical protein